MQNAGIRQAYIYRASPSACEAMCSAMVGIVCPPDTLRYCDSDKTAKRMVISLIKHKNNYPPVQKPEMRSKMSLPPTVNTGGTVSTFELCLKC